jgi:hypothetical protein
MSRRLRSESPFCFSYPFFALGVLVIAEVAATAWWLRARHLAWGRW